MERVEVLKEHQALEDERENENTMRYFAKNNLEGKKLRSKAQFETLHVKESGPNREEVVREKSPSKVKWSGRLGSTIGNCIEKNHLSSRKERYLRIGNVKQISQHDRDSLEQRISMDEISSTLKNTRNNVAPGAGGFTGAFYKVFR